jgi:hypothetical protein
MGSNSTGAQLICAACFAIAAMVWLVAYAG